MKGVVWVYSTFAALSIAGSGIGCSSDGDEHNAGGSVNGGASGVAGAAAGKAGSGDSGTGATSGGGADGEAGSFAGHDESPGGSGGSQSGAAGANESGEGGKSVAGSGGSHAGSAGMSAGGGAGVNGLCTAQRDCAAGLLCVTVGSACGIGSCLPSGPCQPTSCGYAACQASGNTNCSCYTCGAAQICSDFEGCFHCLSHS